MVAACEKTGVDGHSAVVCVQVDPICRGESSCNLSVPILQSCVIRAQGLFGAAELTLKGARGIEEWYVTHTNAYGPAHGS